MGGQFLNNLVILGEEQIWIQNFGKGNMKLSTNFPKTHGNSGIIKKNL